MSKQKTILDFFKAKTPIIERKDEKKPRHRRAKAINDGNGLDRFFKVTLNMSPDAVTRREKLKEEMRQQLLKIKSEKEKQLALLQAKREARKKKRALKGVDKESDLENSEEENMEVRMREVKYSENDYGTEICKHLFLGSAMAASNIEWLEEENIHYIINVTPDVVCTFDPHENPNFKLEDFENVTEKKYLRIPINDDFNVKIDNYFECTKMFIDSAREKGENVLVHCLLGRSRSACIIAAYIMQTYKVKYTDVLNLFKKRDYYVQINDGFYGKLMELQSTIFNEPVNIRKTRRNVSQNSQTDTINKIVSELN
ncbi:dual specificity protein phosphatase, putative [Entamoeba invadens IP1]|uniref:protein-tyrosine-phosphatase n=1 Tax=Entamoeba invadens IP1 TaxID=370355 RepID=A0A0A1TXR2_ENTIV|nr:dual specificity protein phosphatase, putative [Entamoeba invadens IP1]ELP86150.1 dual specificity protein phosphatase, putative [Entamoeba invadens IP1]|eukprot:XP_004185496.1 dual specificity protein phosphatase, putative [Entamoeba invadens IP1]